MKIVCLKGGLGNQMFEYCRYRLLSENQKNGKVYLFRDIRRLKQHNHLSIFDCFDLPVPKQAMWISWLVYGMKALRELHFFPRLYDDERDDCTLIDDYSQDKRFIQNAKELFHFKTISSEQTQKYLSEIQSSAFPVAIHIRRGDYLNPINMKNIGLCSPEYYQQAISLIKKRYPAAQFYIFSDDLEWTKKHILAESAIYVHHEESDPDYVDLYLMTHCKAHIIANSTFSFWGSWLADHQEHLCIYPCKWYQNPNWVTPDIFPEHWISI